MPGDATIRSLDALKWPMLALVALLAGCDGPSAEVHYRISVNIIDHGVVRNGSVVWRERISRPPIRLLTPFKSNFTGEAIPIALPGRGMVFILPTGPGPSNSAIWYLMTSHFIGRVPGLGLNNVEFMRGIAKYDGTTYKVACDYRLTNVAGNPKRLSPEIEKNGGMDKRALCPNIGFSAKPQIEDEFKLINYNELRRLTGEEHPIPAIEVTITKEPATRRIEELLPWLAVPHEQAKRGRSYTTNDEFHIIVER